MAMRPTNRPLGAVAQNPNVPHVPNPVASIDSVLAVVTTLKQGVESLGGHRGGPFDRAVTLSDLVVLGLVTEDQILERLKYQ